MGNTSAYHFTIFIISKHMQGFRWGVVGRRRGRARGSFQEGNILTGAVERVRRVDVTLATQGHGRFCAQYVVVFMET